MKKRILISLLCLLGVIPAILSFFPGFIQWIITGKNYFEGITDKIFDRAYKLGHDK